MTSELPATESPATKNGVIIITAHELPLHCPTKEVALWASHPRVFLDITVTGTAACPYCGTKYQLKEGEVIGHH